jgi:hypothetical protein
VLVGGANGPLVVIIAPKAVRKNNTLCVVESDGPNGLCVCTSECREIILLNDLLRRLSRVKVGGIPRAIKQELKRALG